MLNINISIPLVKVTCIYSRVFKYVNIKQKKTSFLYKKTKGEKVK